MTYDILLALAGFALVSTGTPGPNNMMVMASGANYGYWRTLPHMLGIWSGLGTMLVAMGLGLGAAFDLWPPLQVVLKIASAVYLVYLAWRIANAAAPKGRKATGKPLTTVQAALFQWVNPKAWVMALTTVSAYLPEVSPLTIAIAFGAFTVAAAISNTFWTLLGAGAARFLGSPRRLRAFNWTMAALLVASLVPVLSL